MDLFVVLGLRHGASEGEVKRAYRRLARRHHPDLNPGDPESAARFRLILHAYEILTDPERRSQYESGALPPDEPPSASTEFEGFDFSARAVDYSATFGDLFAEVLSARAARPAPGTRGADLHQQVSLSFAEALAGVSRTLMVTRQESCQACAGVGRAPTPARACPTCGGAGVVKTARGHMVFSHPCLACEGRGVAPSRACGACHGQGSETRVEAVSIRVPPGITDGEHVRVTGKGHVGYAGGVPGDLYVTVAVAPDERYRRDGDDLHVVLPVAVHEAALGARIEFDAPDGPAKVVVPRGTQSGQRLRVRGRGALSVKTGGRGDLVVEARVTLPPSLDERSVELLREFGRLNGGNVRERW